MKGQSFWVRLLTTKLRLPTSQNNSSLTQPPLLTARSRNVEPLRLISKCMAFSRRPVRLETSLTLWSLKPSITSLNLTNSSSKILRMTPSLATDFSRQEKYFQEMSSPSTQSSRTTSSTLMALTTRFPLENQKDSTCIGTCSERTLLQKVSHFPLNAF